MRRGSITYYEFQRKYVAVYKCRATNYFNDKNTWIDESSTETPNSNIARRDAEQLIDHRSICSGTLDETSLQSLGAGFPPDDFAQKTQNLRRENTKDPNIASI